MNKMVEKGLLNQETSIFKHDIAFFFREDAYLATIKNS